MVGVMRWDRVRNLEILRRAELVETLAEKVDRRVLRWSGHVERMDGWRWLIRVKVDIEEG